MLIDLHGVRIDNNVRHEGYNSIFLDEIFQRLSSWQPLGLWPACLRPALLGDRNVDWSGKRYNHQWHVGAASLHPSFGLGGGAVTLLRSDKPRWTESLIAWAAAVIIVLVGCCVIAFLVESGRPIEQYWGLLSFFILIALLIVSVLGRRLGSAETKAEQD